MQKLVLNGRRYAFNIHQKDSSLPYLLMLHGFMGDGRIFDHLVEELCQSCNPVTVDLLGHGKSEQALDPSHYVENKQTDDIKTLTKELDIFPLFLYGYSMGGRLALRTAIQFPELYKGLILESANDGIEEKAPREERRKLDEQRADQILDDFDLFLSKWKTLELFNSAAPSDKALENKYEKIQQSQEPKALSASLRGFSNGNMKSVRPLLSEFHKPVLLIVGNEDEKYVKINDTMAQHFTNVRLKKLNAGHRVHLDNPQELLKNISQFIEQNS